MSKKASLYAGKIIALATMHHKERYLEQACGKILGASLFNLNEAINTDALGTFSGEIERASSQKETALQKCQLGLNISGLSLGLANEGSFGPHPNIPFIGSSSESMVFIDKTREIKLFESMLFTKTNYGHAKCTSIDELTDFLKRSRFPSHGLIVRPNIWGDKTILLKGIQDYTELKKAIEMSCKHSTDHLAHIETDMRAHMNPTRGLNIRKLGISVFRRLTRLCPACQAPGWGRTNLKTGRPCLICKYPTDLPTGWIWSCTICSHQEEKKLSRASIYSDPGWCNLCNP